MADSELGVIDLYSAPSHDSARAAVVGVDGAMFPLKEAPLMQQREGWNLVGFIPAVDVGIIKLQSGWAVHE